MCDWRRGPSIAVLSSVNGVMRATMIPVSDMLAVDVDIVGLVRVMFDVICTVVALGRWSWSMLDL